MRSFTLILLFYLFAAAPAKAQDSLQVTDRPPSLISPSFTFVHASLRRFGVAHELPLGQGDFALRVGGGVDGSLLRTGFGSVFLRPYSDAALFISVEPRWYYNLYRRLERGREVRNNTGMFIGARMMGFSGYNYFDNRLDTQIEVAPRFRINPRWGLRVRLSERFDFEASAGTYVRLNGLARGITYEGGISLDWLFAYRF